jgi:predicted DNA-binding transcriptional regulator AlpA
MSGILSGIVNPPGKRVYAEIPGMPIGLSMTRALTAGREKRKIGDLGKRVRPVSRSRRYVWCGLGNPGDPGNSGQRERRSLCYSELIPAEIRDECLVTPRQVADWLSISVKTVMRWSAAGRLPRLIALGPRKHVFRVKDVRAALARMQLDWDSFANRGA